MVAPAVVMEGLVSTAAAAVLGVVTEVERELEPPRQDRCRWGLE